MILPFAVISRGEASPLPTPGDALHLNPQTVAIVSQAIAQRPALSAVFANDAFHLYRKRPTDSGFALSLEDARAALHLLEAAAVFEPLRLAWCASHILVSSQIAGALLARWDEIDEPPVLNIVRICWNQDQPQPRSLATLGLEPYVGHEIGVSFGPSRGDQYGARTLARLARHALMEGPICDGHHFVGIEGEVLTAQREFDGVPGQFVKVRL